MWSRFFVFGCQNISWSQSIEQLYAWCGEDENVAGDYDHDNDDDDYDVALHAIIVSRNAET